MCIKFQLFDHCLAPNTLGDGTGCDNMTAVIVRFKKLNDTVKSGTETSATTTLVTTDNKKRPAVSPIPSINEGNAGGSVEDDELTAAESKRPKTETV